MLFFTIKFGEIQISTPVAVLLILLTLFTFISVGISSFKLVQSAVEEEED